MKMAESCAATSADGSWKELMLGSGSFDDCWFVTSICSPFITPSSTSRASGSHSEGIFETSPGNLLPPARRFRRKPSSAAQGGFGGFSLSMSGRPKVGRHRSALSCAFGESARVHRHQTRRPRLSNQLSAVPSATTQKRYSTENDRPVPGRRPDWRLRRPMRSIGKLGNRNKLKMGGVPQNIAHTPIAILELAEDSGTPRKYQSPRCSVLRSEGHDFN